MKAKEQHSKQKGQSIIYKRIQRYRQHWAHNTQKDDNESKGTTQQTEGTVNNRESRDTGNIEHTTHRRTTMKAKEQHSKQKGQSIIDNPEVQVTLSTQHTEGRQ